MVVGDQGSGDRLAGGAVVPDGGGERQQPLGDAGGDPGQELLAPIRQLIESVYDTLKGQLDLELHGGRSLTGVTARVAQRILALTVAIWHNRTTGQPVTRSLIAYDH